MDATPIIIKKKKSHGHAHHGGSWKVAYADFVTAMMAFFMVMWIMGLSDDTRAQIQGYFNDPMGFKSPAKSKLVIGPKTVVSQKPGSGNKGMAMSNLPYDDDQKAIKGLMDRMQKAMSTTPELAAAMKNVTMEITSEGLRIEFSENKNFFFETGSAVLKPQAMKVINLVGMKLAASGRKMTIEGHTDTVPFNGNPWGNLELSTDRARALGKALGDSGVSASNCKDFSGKGDTMLKDPAHPTSGINRRVTILLPFEAPLTATVAKPRDEIGHQMSQHVVPDVQVGPAPLNIGR